MKEFFKAGFFRLIFLGLNFLMGLFIATMSGTEMFGTISLMIVNAALLQLITGFGVDQATVWHGAGKKISAEKLFTFTLFTSCFQIFLFVIFSYLFFGKTGKTLLSNSISPNHYYLELIYFSGLILLEKYVSILYAQQRPKVCNLVLLVVSFIAFIFLAFSWFNIIHIVIDPFQFFCLLTLLQALSVILLFHLKIPVFFSLLTRNDFFSIFRFSGLVFAGNIIQFLAYRADFWLINYFKNEHEVGIYSQANRFAGLLWIVPNVIAALLAPSLSTSQSKIDEYMVVRIARVLNYLNLLLGLLIIITSFFVYDFFLQKEFMDGFQPLLYMLPGFYFFSVSIIFAAYFSAKNLLWINLTGAIICLFIIIVADILLIPFFGIKGAAWANTIAYTTATMFTIGMFITKSKLSFLDLFAFSKKDWKLITKLHHE